jgi:hypothetical protein
MNMSYQETLKRQIVELESKIATDIGDVEQMKQALARLQVQEFEEDLRNQGQLLQE